METSYETYLATKNNNSSFHYVQSDLENTHIQKSLIRFKETVKERVNGFRLVHLNINNSVE